MDPRIAPDIESSVHRKEISELNDFLIKLKISILNKEVAPFTIEEIDGLFFKVRDILSEKKESKIKYKRGV